MPPVIKAVCFDFDGTLAHFAGSFAELVDGLRRDLGLTPKDAERLALVRAQAERRGGPMTFADTVRRLRLAQAGKLLRGTTLPVAAIAHRVGYANLSNFNRQFRAHHGHTPREHRS